MAEHGHDSHGGDHGHGGGGHGGGKKGLFLETFEKVVEDGTRIVEGQLGGMVKAVVEKGIQENVEAAARLGTTPVKGSGGGGGGHGHGGGGHH